MVEMQKGDGARGFRLIIAGGGTGGHVFPGVAVGKEILRRHPAAEILFVGGGKRIETEILRDAGIKSASIMVEGIKGRGLMNRIRAMVKLPCGFFQSLLIIKGFSPDLVLGVGGYSSGPVCLAARIMGKRTAIHEQNSFPGATNRLLGRIVDRVFISFTGSRRHFPEGKVCFTGNPIRSDFIVADKGQEGVRGFRILVTGGSQGASAINSAVIGALEILKKQGRAPFILHQTGRADYERVMKEYGERGIKGDVRPFIGDMPGAYREADIFIGRAGAGTVFELAAMGKPSILVPYPFAADNHQESNARMLGDEGGAMIILQDELGPEMLAGVLAGFMDDRESLRKMGDLARKAAVPDAAKTIADEIEKMIDPGRRAPGARKEI